jgi:hydrogenase maturation protease
VKPKRPLRAQGTLADKRMPSADSASNPEPDSLVLGLGNDLLRDDSIGLRVASALEAWPELPEGICVKTTTEMGLALLDFIVGFHSLILIDSVQTGRLPPGRLHIIDLAQLPTLPVVSPHFLGIGEVLALGRTLGMQVPQKVTIIGIEVADPFTVTPDLSPELQERYPEIVREVQRLITPSASCRS